MTGFGRVYQPPQRSLYPDCFIKDDFQAAGTGVNLIGELSWNRTLVGSALGSATILVAGHPGIFQIASGTTNSSLYSLYMRSNAGVTFDPTNDPWDLLWIFRLNHNDAHTQLKIGVANTADADPPTDGCWLEYLLADTHFFAANMAAAAQSARSDLGVVDANWHKLRIRRIAANSIGYTLDAGAEATIATNIPTAGLQPFVQIKNGTDGASKTCSLDYFEMLISGLAR